MKKLTISDVLSMESRSNRQDNNKLSRLNRLGKRNFNIANEGMFDFFRKKTGEETKEKKEEPEDHYVDLLNADKVSVHLYTTSVDDEIKYLEELIHSGIPIFKMDIERLERSFKFIINNHSDILDKLEKLVDIAWLDSKYKVSADRRYLDFNNFRVVVYDLAKDKKWQAIIGRSMDWMDWEEFIPGITEEQIKIYEKLYSLEEAIPNLDFIAPKKIADKSQTRVYLEKGDPKLRRLLDINIQLFEKCFAIYDYKKYDNLRDLAHEADKLTHPVPYGDGDETGTVRIFYHGSYYLYMLLEGFKENFIKNYTAH